MRCNDLRSARAQAGFTLLELLLTVVVMGVLAAVAVPSFVSMVQSQRNTDITTQFAQDVAWARGEALSGQKVVLSVAADGSWAFTEDSYNVSTNKIVTTSFPGHSMTPTQLAADAPGVKCALVVGAVSGSCKQTLTFNSIGIVSVPPGVFEYTTAGSTASFQVFASGTLVPNPSYAS